ncbi:SUKH-3 domain-containing protein [Amycolatopsis roodepoortensis]|uniref:Uncharacterized protein n=1 Tax=Amycolatopsis roodepoortensis TaxID=700274 RepID=A0ABR9LK84_9PSEU|nr:SUKH-3 domain-containing protein [Amycolatopsis roodepoortensis]MBE1581086.1 hypothetical protein [Amycolatopsis roodepoortensis]
METGGDGFVPIGAVDDGHANLLIDKTGWVYLFFGGGVRVGRGRDAVVRLVEGDFTG